MHIVYDTDTGIFSKITMQEIKAPSLSIHVDAVFPVDKGLWFVVSKGAKYLVHKVESIFMRSTPALISATGEQQVILRPAYLTRKSGDMAIMPYDMVFTAEEDQSMWLVLNLSEGVAGLYSTLEPFSYIGDVFLPGVNNTFAEGHLCLGHARVPSAGVVIPQRGMAAFVQEWVDIWSQSPFNADLVYGHHGVTLKFDPETLTNVKIGQTWPSIYPHPAGDDPAGLIRALLTVGNERK
jgi:hypothetical protein